MTILKAIQHSTAEALIQRMRLDAEIAAGGTAILQSLLLHMRHGELAKRVGVNVQNLSAMVAGRRPIPHRVLIAVCELEVVPTKKPFAIPPTLVETA